MNRDTARNRPSSGVPGRRARTLAALAVLAGCGQDDGVDESRLGAPSTPAADGSPIGGGAAGPFRDGGVVPSGSPVRINEIIRQDGAPDLLELINLGPTPIDLGGWTLTDDPAGEPGKAALPAGTVVPAGALVILDLDDSTVGFGLGRAESLVLARPDGQVVDETTWADGQAEVGAAWGRYPDGDGPFRTLWHPTPGGSNDPGLAPDESDATGPESDAGPEPPAPDASGDAAAVDGSVPAPPTAALVVNEVVADGPDGDWVELYNPGDGPAPLAGLFLTDDPAAEPAAFALPADRVLAAGEFFVVPVSGDLTGFGLGSDEVVALVDAEGHVVDQADWAEGEAAAGTSFGRLPDGVGDFRSLRSPTPGLPNRDDAPPPPPEEVCGDGRCVAPETVGQCPADCAPETGLVVNEVIAAGDPVDQVELYNGDAAPIDVSGWFVSDDPEAEPEKGVLPEGSIVPARGYLVLDVDDATVGFRLGSAEAFALTDPAGLTVDRTEWQAGDSPAGGAWARRPNGVGPFRRTDVATPGAVNPE